MKKYILQLIIVLVFILLKVEGVYSSSPMNYYNITTFDPIVQQVDGKTASQVVWLDALLTNVDRTIKNTNMLYGTKNYG